MFTSVEGMRLVGMFRNKHRKHFYIINNVFNIQTLLIALIMFNILLGIYNIYRVTRKGGDFSDDIKLLRSNEFKVTSVFPFHIDLDGVYKQYCKRKYRQETVPIHVIC